MGLTVRLNRCTPSVPTIQGPRSGGVTRRQKRSMQQRVFIGTGLIGSGLAQAAAARGETVTVWNRSRDKAEALAPHGVAVASTPADAVRGQLRVHLALTSDTAVDTVLDTIAPALEREAIVLDHSTTSPSGSKARAEAMEARGVRYLHVPVFMSPVACRNASGMMLVCGPQALYDAVHDELAAMTGRVWYFGPRRDAAAVFKLVGNAVNLAVLGALSDVYAMAGAQGFDATTVQQMLAQFDLSFTISGRGARMAEGNYDTLWSLAMARKDVGLMIDAAQGRPLTVLPALAATMDAMIEAGDGQHDVAVIGRDSISEQTV